MVAKRTTDNGVVEIRLCANKVNALDIAAVRALIDVIHEVGADPATRVVLLGHEGKGYCVGADVKELNADNTLIAKCNAGWYDLFAAIYDCPAPVISVIDGYCIGGGIGMAGASDVVFASEQATFSLPEVKVGALGGATHLIRLVGQFKARAMMYTGETASAAEFARYGGIEAVVPSEELWSAARAMAQKIGANADDAIRLAKASLNFTENVDLKRSYRFEQGFTLELYTSPKAAAARAAQVKEGFKK